MDTAQKTTPGAGQSTYWYNSQGAYFNVVYWDNNPNVPGSFYVAAPWGCSVSWPAGPGPRYYVDIVSSPPWLWWWPDGQSHGCGPCFTGPLSAVDAASSCVRIGGSNATAVNPWSAPTQQAANTWALTQIDGGHWADVVKPALNAAIRSAVTGPALEAQGITGNPPFDQPPQARRVAVDAGHGPDCPGASGVTPPILQEDVLVLEIAQQVAADFTARGYTPIQTRPAVCELDPATGKEAAWTLQERVDTALGMQAQIFVSIHLNGSIDPTDRGTEVWYESTYGNPQDIDASFALAGRVVDQQVQVQPGLVNRGVKRNRIDGSSIYLLEYAANVLMPGGTLLPAGIVLDEVAFLTNTTPNPSDETLLRDPAFRVRVANAIENALRRAFP